MSASAPAALLAIECATQELGVAVWQGGAVRVERRGDPSAHHAESLLTAVSEALAEASLALDDLDAFALAIGPGSFTSLRVGLATLKGLAFGDERPVAAVSTLAAVAHPVLEAGEAECVAALLDARRGEFYAAAYGAQPKVDPGVGMPTELVEETVCDVATLAELLPRAALLAGEALPATHAALVAAGRDDLRVRAPAEAGLRAAAVAALGARMLSAGMGKPASELTPRYLRRPEAEVKRTGLRFEATR